MSGNDHLPKASEGESARQAEVEGTGVAMQGAVDVPRLDTLSITKLACGGKAALLVLKGESRQRAEPVKPLRRIGSEKEFADLGTDGHILAVGIIFNQ